MPGPGMLNPMMPSNFNPMAPSMGGFGTNIGGPIGGFGTNMPSSFLSGQFGAGGSAPLLGNTGQGPRIESFQKDGFKITGAEPIKTKNEEGQREFAELFSLADTKIKDRAHEKPRFDLSYNPINL